MDNLDIVVHETAHAARGGVEGLAMRMGVRAQTLRNKVNGNEEFHRLSLREAIAIMQDTNNTRILECVAAMFGLVVEPKAVKPIGNIVAAILESDAEHGDVNRVIRDALIDGRLTQREKARVFQEIREARVALDVLEAEVDAHGR